VAIITLGYLSKAARQSGRQDECEKTRPKPGFQCRKRQKMKKIAATPSRKADKSGKITNCLQVGAIF
tara:strand:+ start:190 stop:390 length:201 start_codon:yes stop_codon:yes gene_type:complete